MSDVRAYTLSTCPYCRAFKEFMKRNEITVECVDVDLLEGEDRDTVLEEVDEICPGCGYPIILIGDDVIVGFNERRLREALKL